MTTPVKIPPWRDSRQGTSRHGGIVLSVGQDSTYGKVPLEHPFRYRQGVGIDVVPFGRIERENGLITLALDETRMTVLGFHCSLHCLEPRRWNATENYG